MKRVLIVGRYPPPTGGNTIHIQRLARRLHSDGHHVSVADLYATDPIGVDEPFPILTRARGVWGAMKFVGNVQGAASGAVAHVHISAGSQFYKVGLPLLWVLRAATKRVLTIHSGSWAKEFEALSPAMRRLAIQVLSHFDDLVCVNEQQRSLLTGLVTARTHVIPAYLPAIPCPEVTLSPLVRNLRGEVQFLIVASGYETPIYGFETLLRAANLAQRRLDKRIGVVVSTYGAHDPTYWTAIEKMFSQVEIPIVHTRDLKPEEFARVVATADMYVRPTTTDGDAVALREAASAGLQVLASDAVPRPTGVAMFPTRDVQALASLLVQATSDGSIGRVPLEDRAPDYYRKLSRVYFDY